MNTKKDEGNRRLKDHDNDKRLNDNHGNNRRLNNDHDDDRSLNADHGNGRHLNDCHDDDERLNDDYDTDGRFNNYRDDDRRLAVDHNDDRWLNDDHDIDGHLDDNDGKRRVINDDDDNNKRLNDDHDNKRRQNGDFEPAVSIRKTTNWEMYGVKHFRYKGYRKNSPLLYQTFDGDLSIHNDIFGLTIHQFEREFRSCLQRRIMHEQSILNIRFPDKTSNDYLEYLEDCEFKSEGHTSEFCFKEKWRFQRLQKIVGTEKVVRSRQRLLKLNDFVDNNAGLGTTKLSSGSLAEGLDLPGSDIDIMYIVHNIDVVQDVKEVYRPGHATFLMEKCDKYPGFAKLKLVTKHKAYVSFLVQTDTGIYFSSQRLMKFLLGTKNNGQIHGPCLSDRNQHEDIAFCLRSRIWPREAVNWIYRRRRWQWPFDGLVESITRYGILLVPIGPKYNENEELWWRLSFSVAEKKLCHSYNYTQLLCYSLLKMTLKNVINKNDHVKDLLCSYFMKTTLFWVSEEISIDQFQVSNLMACFELCLDKLTKCIDVCYLPNYFIPEQNLFKGKINTSNNKTLLSVFTDVKYHGMEALVQKVLSSNDIVTFSPVVEHVERDDPFKLEILFYKILLTSVASVASSSVEKYYTILALLKQISLSESSTFLRDVFKYYHGFFNQQVTQMLFSTFSKNKQRYYLSRKILRDGTMADAGSGWLLSASFFYAIENYNVALRIVDYILSRCSPDMLYLGCFSYQSQTFCMYQRIAHCKQITLKDRMRLATMGDMIFIRGSPLIPKELQYEVKDFKLRVPPVVMCHCLQFLCNHHLNDFYKRKLSLQDLRRTIQNEYLLAKNEKSVCYTLLGVCYEISNNMDLAYRSYVNAVRCEGDLCKSAKLRLEKIISTRMNGVPVEVFFRQ
ncbi:uncharacterized protein LOC127723378 isoform X2 [Mytilus californianus]|uniref:uncharacterized protein LOC127723378 isoform X2 n=1 Tax=Mytilus californianus TaxID=6549 RepID=UPI00224809F4|nr:uncharacterized protein LOC127723378 isoform X2 [Mytilus californianus]